MKINSAKMKKMKFYLIVLLCIVLSILAVKALQNHTACARMLHAVGLDDGAGLQQVDYAYWRDPLKYVDGYEIMAFAVDEAVWNPPDSWTKATKLTSIDSIATELGIDLNMKAILNLSLGGENCGVWFFADHRADRPFDQQDFYFAYCDETYRNNVVLFVYRGHSLYGI